MEKGSNLPYIKPICHEAPPCKLSISHPKDFLEITYFPRVLCVVKNETSSDEIHIIHDNRSWALHSFHEEIRWVKTYEL